MRSESSEVGARGGRTDRLGARRAAARKEQRRRLALEGLEARELLAVVPTPTIADYFDASRSRGNESSPTIAVNQLDPQKLVAVWVRNDPQLLADFGPNTPTILVEAAFSNNGGQTWNSLSSGLSGLGSHQFDPATTNPTLRFQQGTDASVAFDRNNNIYVLTSQHNAANSSGVLTLSKFNFAGTVPTAVFTNRTVYQWGPTSDPALNPMLAVDDSVATFSDLDAQGQPHVQDDPFSGNVYIAWISVDTPTAGNPFGANFNPNRVQMLTSSDGGQTFGGILPVNDPGNFGAQRNATPRLVVSQGRPAGTTGPTDPGIPGGQVAVVWDDTNSGATGSPPFDILWSDRVSAGAAKSFTSAGGLIADAVNPGADPHVPATTPFTQTVSIADPRFTNPTDLDVTVSLVHPALQELRLELVAPDGSTITLVRNQSDAFGTAVATRGVSGANLGLLNGFSIGTTLDDDATRGIVDLQPGTTNRGAAAPFIGHYQPETGSLDAFVAALGAGGINGDWTLNVTDFRNGNVGNLLNWKLTFTSDFVDGTDTVIDTTIVRGAARTGSATSPSGIGPGVVIASDNTLGAFSPRQGRLYAAYADRYNIPGNPADNTDIFLMASDDGGITWSGPTDQAITQTNPTLQVRPALQVNDDLAVLDGFSESNPGLAGRPQFMPQVAVDPVTGTLVMSWLDARYDAARARVATFLAASIDGGQTFSDQKISTDPDGTVRLPFADPPFNLSSVQGSGRIGGTIPTDAITGEPIFVGPTPVNQSPGNPNTEATFNFGGRQGLAVYGGKVHPLWASNLNGGPDGKQLLDIVTATATIAAGPRVVDSTMGPVGKTDQFGTPIDTVNIQRAADGTPIASAFEVVFDRPVDPASFQANDVQVFFRDTTPGNASGGLVPVQSVVPLNEGPFGPAGAIGATRFRVNFAPRSAVGTYSYTLGPGIQDRIRGPIITVPVVEPVGSRSSFSALPSQQNLRLPPFGQGGSGNATLDTTRSRITVAGFPAGQVVEDVTVTMTLQYPFDGDLVATLVSPSGTRVTLVQNRPIQFLGGPDFTNTTFTDAATDAGGNPIPPIAAGLPPYTGSFHPEQPLALLDGEAINGDWTLEIEDQFPQDTGLFQTWSLSIQAGQITGFVTRGSTGNPMDQDADAVAGEPSQDSYSAPGPVNPGALNAPFRADTLPLIVPGPHVISSRVPGAPISEDNLVADRPVSAIDVTFDRDMAAETFTAADVLRVMGPLGPVAGPYGVSAVFNAAAAQVGKNTVNGGTITSIVTIPDDNGEFKLSDLNVRVDLTHPHAADLTLTLIAPNGDRFVLAQGVGGTSGKNFTDTVFDDQAAVPITQGVAPYSGSFRPVQALSALDGRELRGVWTLEVQDASGNGTGRLNSWSLEARPTATGASRTFRVTFPSQQLSGTYVVTFGPNILSRNGSPLDANQDAGLALLRTVGAAATSPTAEVTFTSTDIPKPIADPGRATSTITVGDNFVIAGLELTLNIAHPNVSDLDATLIGPDGTRVKLFANLDTPPGVSANFTNTTFTDDLTAVPIQNGAPPYFGRFNPQQPLSAFTGKAATGTWTLEVNDTAGIGQAGTVTGWSLKFKKPVPNSGLGEAVADQAAASFRIFNMAPTNPLASSTWTAVGPAAINNGENSGRIGGLAIDPSDPSGNTVFAAGGSGGVWKTRNFLTTNPGGPTWIPLTDFGPTNGVNIGSIAVFPRNGDPDQSIVIVSTGEGDNAGGGFSAVIGGTGAGVGFLRSFDGGATWDLLDSTINVDDKGVPLPFNSPLRDHTFLGTTSFKVLVDPRTTPDGNVIIYAALSGDNAGLAGSQGGVWRSLDTGRTWQQMLAGQATDIALDYASATGASGGNLQTIFAAFRGDVAQAGEAPGGVYISTNRGAGFTLMAGGVGVPLIQDGEVFPSPPIPVTAPADTPNGAKGRIVLAKPGLTSPDGVVNLADVQYQGWLYAAVVRPDDHLDGLYLTKDFGQNWTKVRMPTLPPRNGVPQAVPTNDPTRADYDIAGSGAFSQGNYDISLIVDPNNPAVVYLGGTRDGQPTGLLRVDTTALADPHALVAYENDNPDGGLLTINTTGALSLKRPVPPNNAPPPPFFNLIRDPANPFLSNATILVPNSARFNNQGTGATWTPFDFTGIIEGSTDQHRVVAMRDPVTGYTRLIFGDDQGVFSGVVRPDGTLQTSVGTVDLPTGRRSGNLQITQFYYGASQPSGAAAQVAQALFYGQAQDVGFPASRPGIIDPANASQYGRIGWFGPEGDGTGVATDQTGSGISYRYDWRCCGESFNNTDFFLVDLPPQGNPIGRTFGLIQSSTPPNVPDSAQWPFLGGFNFAVNPIDGNQIIISSGTGRVFRTENQGVFWSAIGEPATFQGRHAEALAFGAPDPNGPGGVGNLDNFIYVGTEGGRIYVTQTGGGSWQDITNGDLANDGSPVRAIVTNPTRGTHEAYAVTARGVYHIVNAVTNPGQPPTTTWKSITGDLFGLTHQIFDDTTMVETQLKELNALAVDWRYVIPRDVNAPADPATNPTHPLIYVAGNAGVYRSIDATDDGTTASASWRYFPDPSLTNTPTPPGAGGALPRAVVNDLDLALGNINPTTGRADASQGPNVLLATTFGRGSFAIRLAPLVFPDALKLSSTQPAPGGSDSGADSGDNVTNVVTPVIEGLSQQTAFGAVVTIELIDLTDPTNPVVIGTGTTDAAGRFVHTEVVNGETVTLPGIRVDAGHFKTDGSTDGIKTIGVRARDQFGTEGNLATLVFELDTTSPVAPAAPDLTAATDTGLSSTDNITRDDGDTAANPPRPAPVFDVATAEPDTTIVILLRNGIEVNRRQGAGAVSDPGPVPEGDNFYRVQLVDQAGNASALSEALKVTIDVTAPVRPDAPVLDPADDSGTPGDNITNVRRPRLTGTAEANGLVQIIDAVGTVIGQAAVGPNGSFSVQPDNDLTSGTYALRVRAEDVAGNFSSPSDPLTLVVQTNPPAAPTIGLVASDDSGVRGDRITKVNPPQLSGLATAGVTVDLLQVATTSVSAPGLPVAIPDLGTATASVVVAGLPTGSVVTDVRVGLSIIHPRASDLVLTLIAPGGRRILLAQNRGGIGANYIGTTFDDAAVDANNNPRPITIASAPFAGAFRPEQALGGLGGLPASGTWTLEVADTASGVVGQITDFTLTLETGVVLNSVIAAPNNSYLITFPGPLPDGPITVRARARDVAGNTSLSPRLTLTIDTTPPTGQPTLRLLEADDTGRAGDSTTVVRRPRLTGTAEPGATVVLTRADVPVDQRVPLATAIADGKGAFVVRLPSDLTNGRIALQVSVTDAAGNQGSPSTPLTLTITSTALDFDGDGKADLALFRPALTGGEWYQLRSSAGPLGVPFGAGSDIALNGDYDGDGKADLAVFRPETAQWFIRRSTLGGQGLAFGWAGVDVPVPADYDGDGKTDLALYRPPTGQWFILQSTAGVRVVTFGQAGVDVPVPADYDGDGKADLATFRPTTAEWSISSSRDGTDSVQALGQAGVDVPVPADYDGDGKTDLAVYRPTTAEWFIRQTTAGGRRVLLGQAGVDVPVPADYDGDGKADLAVYRPPTGQWFIRQSADGRGRLQAFGGPIDLPLASPFAYRRTFGARLSARSSDDVAPIAAPASTAVDAVIPQGSSAPKKAPSGASSWSGFAETAAARWSSARRSSIRPRTVFGASDRPGAGAFTVLDRRLGERDASLSLAFEALDRFRARRRFGLDR